jgi:pantetheine-phosphate adenylyltransferase
LVNYAASIGAQYIIRGLRNVNDFTYEQTMMQENRKINPTIDTIFIIADREYADVSSSLVKGLIGPNGWEDVVKDHLPVAIQNRFFDLMAKKNLAGPYTST